MVDERDEGRSGRGGEGGSEGTRSGGRSSRSKRGGATEEVRASASEARTEAGAKARELKQEAKEKGEELKERAREEGESRKAELSERVSSVTAALERAAEALDERGESWMAGQARGAAEKVRDLSRYLDDRDVESLMRDLQGAARTNPGTFLGGSFAAGLALGRFLRASAPADRYEGSWEGRVTPERGYGPVTGESGFAASRGYIGTPGAEGLAPDSTASGSGGVGREPTGSRGRWSSGGTTAERMNEPERPGTRTGGSAMASREAGSGRSTARDRSEAEGERGGEGGAA